MSKLFAEANQVKNTQSDNIRFVVVSKTFSNPDVSRVYSSSLALMQLIGYTLPQPYIGMIGITLLVEVKNIITAVCRNKQRYCSLEQVEY